MPRYRSSRWILIVAVLALLGGAAIGALYIIRRGMQKEGLYEQAVRAMREGRPADAEQKLRTLLLSAPDNTTARVRLIGLLKDQGRILEAEGQVEEWIADSKAPLLARQLYCELALRRWRLDLAEQRARMLLEDAPEFAYRTLIHAHEARGTLPDLRQAIKLALNLTLVTDDPATQVVSWQFAAETMIDLLPALPEGDRAQGERAARSWLQLASRRLEIAAKNRAFPREVALARIEVLSDKPEDRSLGEEGLRLALSREPRDYLSRASLAKFLIREGRLDEALSQASGLKEAPYTLWRGVLLAFVMRDHGSQAQAMLEDPPLPDDPMVKETKARYLLQAEAPDERARGVALLLDLQNSPAFGVPLAARVFAILSGAGEADAAREIIEAALARGPDLRLEALLLAASATTDPESAASAELTTRLADQASDFERSVQVLGILRPAGREAVLRFLDAQIEAGHAEARHRLLRAATHVLHPSADGEDEEEGRKLAEADLEALAGLECDRATLAAAARLALAAQLPETAGRLYGKALCLEPVVDTLASEVLRRAMGTDDEEVRSRVAAGMREVAGSAAPREFLEALANALVQAREGVPELETKLEGMRNDPEAGPRATLMLLQLRELGFHVEQPAIDLARSLCASRPEDLAARVLLGEHLRAEGQWDALYDCWAGRDTPLPTARDQWVVALWQRGEKEQAFASAREFERSRPGDPQAEIMLARLHALADENDEALAILGAAPPSPAGSALQARILTHQAETRQSDPLADSAQRRRAWDVAEAAWRDLVRTDAGNRAYWDGLVACLTMQGRRDELINVLTKTIANLEDSGTASGRGLARDLLLRRAMLQEQSGRTDAALVDYISLIDADQPPTDFVSRNNAAWIIQEHYTARIEEAVRFVEEALTLQPDSENLRDTAAMVYLRAGRHDDALEQADKALAIASRPSVMRTRAIVLEGSGRQEDADAQWQELLDAFPDSPEAVEAHARVSGPEKRSGSE